MNNYYTYIIHSVRTLYNVPLCILLRVLRDVGVNLEDLSLGRVSVVHLLKLLINILNTTILHNYCY